VQLNALRGVQIGRWVSVMAVGFDRAVLFTSTEAVLRRVCLRV
jgi:hypothetical protein